MPNEANTSGEGTKTFDLDRTVALSDGIFAFALTLLVLSISVPDLPANASSAELWTEMQTRWTEIVSYLVSFIVIGRFWIRHHRFCGSLKAVNGPFLVLNLAFLATIAFIPYPTQLLGDFGNSTAFSFYAVAIALAVLASVSLSEYASQAGLVRDRKTAGEVRLGRINGLGAAVGFLISIPVVFVTGDLIWGYLCWVVGANLVPLLRL